MELTDSGFAGGFVLLGADAGTELGNAVDFGDINADGLDDLLAGAADDDPAGQNYAGGAVLLFGSSQAFGATINAQNLNGSDGVRISGEASNDRAGSSVAVIDLDGDGAAEAVLGAPFATGQGQSDAGVVYVVAAGSLVGTVGDFALASVNGSNGFRFEGGVANGQLGASLSSAGNLNGAGPDDLLVGAPGLNDGQAFVVFGSPTLPLSLQPAQLNGSNGFSIVPPDDAAQFGFQVAATGDWNADGIDDAMISDYQAKARNNDYAGRAYLVFGQAGVFPGQIDIGSVPGDEVLWLEGVNKSDRLGTAVGGQFDFNGDGIDELVISAPRADPAGSSSAGSVYVLFGR